MKKITALFLSVFAIQAFSTETICAPDFEVFGMNQDFGKSSAKVLQGNMQTRMGQRQLVIPSATDSVAVTDDLNHQINWAKNRGCAYLLQTSLTRLGETVQVGAHLTDLNNNPVFKRVYKASTPDDLHPIFGQIGNTLQDSKFTPVESIYDVTNADAKRLTKKKSSTYYDVSIGASYFKDFEELYNIGAGYFWDNRTFMGELVFNWGFKDDNSIVELLGIRLYYPFSDRNSAFYIGGGAGFAISSKPTISDDYDYLYGYNDSESNYGLLIECAAGYLMGRTSNVIFRIEANGSALISEGAIGGGLRLILGIGD